MRLCRMTRPETAPRHLSIYFSAGVAITILLHSHAYSHMCVNCENNRKLLASEKKETQHPKRDITNAFPLYTRARALRVKAQVQQLYRYI